MNMGSAVSYNKVAGETTEWEDILRKKGVTGPTKEEIARDAAEAAEKLAEEARERIDPLEHKTLAELDEMGEEGGGFEDERTLESYRLKRLAEIKAAASRNRFGQVLPLSRAEFVAEVNDASKHSWVVVFLHQEHVPESSLLEPLVRRIAARHKEVKFLHIRADSCIEGYPDKNVPTMLLYHDGSMQSQIVGLGELGGTKVSLDILEWVLARKGVMSTEQMDDPREALRGGRAGAGGGGGGGGSGWGRRKYSDDSD